MNWEKQHEATGGRLVLDWETLHARFRGVAPRRDAASDGDLLGSSSMSIPTESLIRRPELLERPANASKAS